MESDGSAHSVISVSWSKDEEFIDPRKIVSKFFLFAASCFNLGDIGEKKFLSDFHIIVFEKQAN